MYPVSKATLAQLGPDGQNRRIDWYGSMVTNAGVTYEITTDIIDSGTIKQASWLPFIGGAYSGTLQCQLKMRDVDARTLKGARIEIYARVYCVDQSAPKITWGDLSVFTWGEISQYTWDIGAQSIYAEIPMGVFFVEDAKRHQDSIKITASDSMVKFDSDLPGMDSTSRSAYYWLLWACDACGVELGMTKEQVKALPNGTRSFIYAVLESEVKTYRYLIGQLAAALGSVALIDRYGKLVLRKMNQSSVAEITQDDRFTSEYEDTQSKYTGLCLQYKSKAVQEYYRNVDAISDTGNVVDLKDNPFLQISNDSARNATLKAIVDSFAGVNFTPFKATIPCHPEYDLLDVVTFTNGHAPDNCHGPITSVTWTINGGVSIQCATPKEQVKPDRRNVQTEGVSGSRVSGGDFWIKASAYPESSVVIAVEQNAVTTELTVNCTTDNTTMQIAWTGCYVLDEDATVAVDVLVDEKSIYTVSDDQKAGTHVMNVTTGHAVGSMGEYVIKIVLREVAL